MGRLRCYRERIQFEMHSVRAKSVRALLSRTLQENYGLSRMEAAVLAQRSHDWLGGLEVQVPGQVCVSVPETPSRRLSQSRRRLVLITAVDVAGDTEVWEQWGLPAMQRARLLRWLMEIYRQGGWGSLKEVAAWANLTPTALGTRLRPVKDCGVWLPHVGGAQPSKTGLCPEPWLVGRYLEDGHIERWRSLFGVSVSAWEGILRRFVAVLQGSQAGRSLQEIAAQEALGFREVEEFVALGNRWGCKSLLRDLVGSYGRGGKVGNYSPSALEAELREQYGFSTVAARLYREEFLELARGLGDRNLTEGQMVFFALAAEEGPRSTVAEGRHVPVEISFYTPADASCGPYGASPTRVAEMKFGRILRYATEARSQGALLSVPDLAVLMGIHGDAVRRQIARHPQIVVPTRGRIKDIGRGVSHKVQIIELYLQMHTETEIVDRTGHSYESVEAYLREFARILTLAEQGMNQVMIRRITGRSMGLVESYLELCRRYQRPEYYFRLAHLRRAFTRPDRVDGKKGAFRFPTGGAGR